jgi:uncharacterized RDD family membrane protein YckC
MSEVATADKYRTFWRRVGAAIIDSVVMIPLMWLLDPDTYGVRAPLGIVVIHALNYSVPILYSVLLHARYGQTWGKMAVGVTVMNLDESQLPTLRQAVLRDIGEIVINGAIFIYLASFVMTRTYTPGDEYQSSFWEVLAWASVSWTVLEIVTMLTNKKRRAVHDFIAGTVVIRSRSQENAV